MKLKKAFNIVNMIILLVSFFLLGIGVKIGISNLSVNSNETVVSLVKNTDLDNNKSNTKDITEVSIETLTEPKTEEEKVLAYGFYNYSSALLEKLKKEHANSYPQFGMLKDEIKIMGPLFVGYGTNKSIIKNKDNIFEDKKANGIYKYPDSIFNFKAKTIYNFDNNNQLIGTLSEFDYEDNLTDEFKTIRDKLIQYHGQPTFQNVFLTPKDKFNESKDKDITYVIRWESSKKSVMLTYDKAEKNNFETKLILDYSLNAK
ncbi:hypothetical protein [Clostridium sp.]|uniref:hypothetical protein n=1 Tax=Clostridium sp. TaxID=1506 RepID=UPI0039E919C9